MRRAALVLIPTLCLGGCHSFVVTRHTIDVTSGTQRIRVHVWQQERGPLAESSFATAVLCSVVLYPFNVLPAVVYGASAPFSAKEDVRFGPLGWLAGTLVPGCTLAGPIKRIGADDVELSDEHYARFAASLHGGGGREAVLVGPAEAWWPIVPDAVVDAAPAGDDEPKTSHGSRPRRRE